MVNATLNAMLKSLVSQPQRNPDCYETHARPGGGKQERQGDAGCVDGEHQQPGASNRSRRWFDQRILDQRVSVHRRSSTIRRPSVSAAPQSTVQIFPWNRSIPGELTNGSRSTVAESAELSRARER